MLRRHPVDGPLHLAPAGVAAAALRIILAAHRHHVAAGVALDARTLHDVGVAQAHLDAGGEPKTLGGRGVAEVVLLDIKDPAEWHATGAGRGVLRAADRVEFLALS